MKKHVSGSLWLLVFFFLISAALCEHHWLWLILSIVTFFTDVLIFNKAPIWLRIDRMLVGENKSWILDLLRPILFFAIVCLFIFDLMFCVLNTAHQSPSRSQLFADMVSPVSLRSTAYSPRDSANTIEAKLLIQDSVPCTSTGKNPKLIATGAETYSPRHFFLLAILYLLGSVFIMGFFIASIKQVFDSRVTKYKDGLTTYGRFNKHYVVIGYGEIAIPIIESIDKKDTDAFIILLTEQNVHHLRPLLEERKSNNRILVYSGDIELESNLKRLRMDKAEGVYVLGEGEERSRDAKNIALLSKIKEIRKASKDSLDVFVQLDKLAAYATIKRLSLNTYAFIDGEEAPILNIKPFNYYENCARQLWGYWGEKAEEVLTPTLDNGELVTDSKKHVQIVIAGFGSMGQALLLEALNICHFPNYAANPNDSSLKTRICVVDPKMNHLKASFEAQYAELSQILDITIEYRTGLLEDIEMRKDIAKWATDDNTLLTIAICIPDSDQSLSSALNLPRETYYRMVGNKPEPTRNVQILTNQEIYNKGMRNIIFNEDCKMYGNVHTFGSAANGWSNNIMSDVMPIWINYFYTNAQPKANYVSILDEYDVSEYRKIFQRAKTTWMKLTEEMKCSNRYQIDMYGTVKRYKDSNKVSVETLMKMEHARWMADRAIIGYKYICGEKDINYKLHPCMKTFDSLPEKDKNKDKQVINNLELVQRLYDFHVMNNE